MQESVHRLEAVYRSICVFGYGRLASVRAHSTPTTPRPQPAMAQGSGGIQAVDWTLTCGSMALHESQKACVGGLSASSDSRATKRHSTTRAQTRSSTAFEGTRRLHNTQEQLWGSLGLNQRAEERVGGERTRSTRNLAKFSPSCAQRPFARTLHALTGQQVEL